MGLAQAFFAAAETQAEKPAIVCGDNAISFGRLAQNVRQLSQALSQNGMAPGDCIGVAASNSIAFATLLLAAADCGAMVAPVSPALPADAMRRAFAAADVRHIALDGAALQTVRSDDLNCAGFRFSLDAAAFAALIDGASAGAPSKRQNTQDAPFIISMTSGSTGEPKPIVLTQGAKIARAKAATTLYDVTSADIILAATPLYHSLAERLLFTALLNGATCILMPSFTPQGWLHVAEHTGASFTIAVSTQLAQIARHMRDTGERRMLPKLRAIVSSSAPLRAEDKDIIQSAFAAAFHECYGASEIAIATSLNLSAGDAPCGSVGRAAPGVDIAILDEQGRPLTCGETGEIACRTPMMFAGYLARADLTYAAMAGDYFRTGDLGRIDETGALYYLGRTKEMIVSGGMKIYPRDVEAALSELADVIECAAFALPDDVLGEQVGLAIVGAASARAVRKACLERLADFQQPRRIIFIDALPRNGMGKLQRHLLPELALRSTEKAA
jgi:long-chain acyl-CoA synthetase